MGADWNRRDVLKGLLAASAATVIRAIGDPTENSDTFSQSLEVQLAPVSSKTLRLTILPVKQGSDASTTTAAIRCDGSLVQESWGPPAVRLRIDADKSLEVADFRLTISPKPLSISVSNEHAELVQRLVWDEKNAKLSFLTGNGPLFGLGEGGQQYDRRGSVDSMKNGQGAYKLPTHGGRVPIPWIIGTSGWAMFLHQPFGAFDLTGSEGRFQAADATSALPLDLFLVASSDPTAIMAEYARLTGHAQMPPLWSLGYQQSHRTLAGREEVIAEAKAFRQKKLPCDTLIYLGTGFCPSGWNTANGSFDWNSRVFPEPKEALDELHEHHFRAVLHVVILSDKLRGRVSDPCELARFDEAEASCHWAAHRKDFAMGVDGWWPDEGDALDIASRLARNRMYWEGPQLDRPNERPYSLHRNGYAGMQRFGSFLWSGDVYSTWETLKTQIPIGLNTGVSGIPYWGTDIGGFVPTPEFTAELYLRWFQFGAFCPLFRCHGRTWKLRLPWGWNTGDPGPVEIRNYDGASTPDPGQLHDARVEPICRKYLELRYRLLPYLYSAVRECTITGMPIMRALWLHFPHDPKAVERSDEYLWGSNLLVAPVFEKGARTRDVYLPAGDWYDFWTAERLLGEREIRRAVDLETLPLYVRAGTILPLGPVKQFTDDKIDEPLSVSIYPGADGSFLLYEDDGVSFNYRNGEWMGIQLSWNDVRRVLLLDVAPASRMLAPAPREIVVRLAESTQNISFHGAPIKVKF